MTSYYNRDTWMSDTMEWQQRVVRKTEPVNFEEAYDAITTLYRQIGKVVPSKGNVFISPDPLAAAGVYFHMLYPNRIPLANGSEYFYDLHRQSFSKLARLPQSQRMSIIPILTLANFGTAWADDVVDPSINLPHSGKGTILEDMGFGKGGDYPDENSMLSDSMDHVVPHMVAMRNILDNGNYQVCGNRYEEVNGYGVVEEKDQLDMFMDNGQWQMLGMNLWHIYKNGYNNSWVDAFLRLYHACGPWIATESYIILVDRPRDIEVDGPNALMHNPDGPTIDWGDYKQYHIEGIPVPERWVTEGIDYEEITKEQNTEIRSMMLRHFGLDRYISEVGATEIDSGYYQGEWYKLYRTRNLEGDTIHLLEMRDSTHTIIDKDGNVTPKVYVIPVTTEFDTIAECVADMARTTPDNYNMVYQT